MLKLKHKPKKFKKMGDFKLDTDNMKFKKGELDKFGHSLHKKKR